MNFLSFSHIIDARKFENCVHYDTLYGCMVIVLFLSGKYFKLNFEPNFFLNLRICCHLEDYL